MKLYVVCKHEDNKSWKMYAHIIHKEHLFLQPYIFTTETSALDFILEIIKRDFIYYKQRNLFAAQIKEFNDLLDKEPFSSQTLSNPLIETFFKSKIKIFEIESDQFR